ncbi:glycosyltransferase [Alcanivorax sp. S6407]|uniref:glycosyltransferase n=1 Tax=Alcanivorax sp. S6407 TaxID=2926424 RepID=UPI001FF49A3F|nr:glycosyltransferase [Alcanivorax sp. S6407]MCK0152730.1 glycosyltransferase [Alcanivorax sp. S6407]
MDTKTLRVLFVVDAIKGRNGVGAYFQDLVSHLEGQVERVELVQPCLQEPHPCQGASMPIPGDPTQRLFFPRVRELSALVWEMKPHVIVIPGPGIFSMIGYWIAKKWGIPVCVTFQTDYNRLVELYWGKRLARLAGGFLNWVNRTLFQGSETAATICESMIAQARAAGARNPQLVGTPLAREFVQTPIQPLAEQVSRVCYVGRLAAEKNIESFLVLAASRPDLQFEVAGDGPLRGKVEEACQRCDNLTLLGWCSREQVVELIDRSQVLVLPSSVEAFGTVALEAMARQRLVITTPACGINEWPALARGLWIMEEGEELTSTLQRLSALTVLERRNKASDAREAARAMNHDAIAHWGGVLAHCAAMKTKPSSLPSPTLALLRRLSSHHV